MECLSVYKKRVFLHGSAVAYKLCSASFSGKVQQRNKSLDVFTGTLGSGRTSHKAIES